MLACLLASIQPRTSPSKFGGKFNSIFIRLLEADAAAAEPSGRTGSASANYEEVGMQLANELMSGATVVHAYRALASRANHLASAHAGTHAALLRTRLNNIEQY